MVCLEASPVDMTTAWQIAFDNFREDDGSLPSVEFDKLQPSSVANIYRYMRANGRCVSESPTLWDETQQKDVPLLSIDNPCDWIQDGRVDSFHCCFGDMSMGGTTIPDLGVSAFRDAVQIDFRMGEHWNEANTDAFFRLLAHLKSLAPEARIKSAETEGLMNENSFRVALASFLPENVKKEL